MSAALKQTKVQVSGESRRPMFFARGCGCDRNMWRLIVPAFSDEYRIVLEICRERKLADGISVSHSVSAMGTRS